MGHHSDSKTTYKQEFFERHLSMAVIKGQLAGILRDLGF